MIRMIRAIQITRMIPVIRVVRMIRMIRMIQGIRMIQMIGIGRLKEMMMTTLPVNADTAERWGLVNRVFASNGLLEGTLDFARVLVERAPLAPAPP